MDRYAEIRFLIYNQTVEDESGTVKDTIEFEALTDGGEKCINFLAAS